MDVTFEMFKKKFSDAIEDESILELDSKANFRNLESWDSFSGMSVISMIDDEFGITINANEMARINTLHELFEIISNKNK